MVPEDPVAAPSTPPRAAGSWPADREALDRLFNVAYGELRRLASSVRRGDPSATLNPTALVNEAWLKLAKSPEVAATSTLHFKRIAARAMRQLLIEAARRRDAGKRGGGAVFTVSLDAAAKEKTASSQELLALDSALQELGEMSPRQAAMVELRFFGGLTVGETAAALNVSEPTVLRDWRAAKAWLAHKLRHIH